MILNQENDEKLTKNENNIKFNRFISNSGIFLKKKMEIGLITPNQFFGEEMINLESRKFSVICNTNKSEVFYISKKDFFRRLSSHPELTNLKKYINTKSKWRFNLVKNCENQFNFYKNENDNVKIEENKKKTINKTTFFENKHENYRKSKFKRNSAYSSFWQYALNEEITQKKEDIFDKISRNSHYQEKNLSLNERTKSENNKKNEKEKSKSKTTKSKIFTEKLLKRILTKNEKKEESYEIPKNENNENKKKECIYLKKFKEKSELSKKRYILWMNQKNTIDSLEFQNELIRKFVLKKRQFVYDNSSKTNPFFVNFKSQNKTT